MALTTMPLGRTGLRVSNMGLGGTGLANMYHAIADDAANALVQGAAARGVTLFDTAPCYGVGLSEARLGNILPKLDRNSFVLSSKVGYDLVPQADGLLRLEAEGLGEIRLAQQGGASATFEFAVRPEKLQLSR